MIVGECPVCKERASRRTSWRRRTRARSSASYTARTTRSAGWATRFRSTARSQATGEVCEHCGAPMVIVTTARGPVEALPQLRLPRQGAGRGEKGRVGREGGREEGPGQEGARQKARGEEGSREEAGCQEGFLRQSLAADSRSIAWSALTDLDSAAPRLRCPVPAHRPVGRAKASGSCRTLFTSFLRWKAGFPTCEAGQAISVDRFP